ncbi:MAG: hypothetical protein KAT47_02405 [Candidatus Aegiribacteria sp.]|nr:hypothetical protein [Candidatus Aegiribacteria sp.]
MLRKTSIHYMNLLQDDIDDRKPLIRQFSGFHHNTQFFGQASSVIVYIAAGIIIASAAIAGLLILLQT